MKATVKTLAILFLIMQLQGCMTRLNASMAPGANIEDFGKIYVQNFEPDRRNLHRIIADQLTMLGYPASPIDDGYSPEDADILVTYVDNWRWDITNYMIKIKINVRNAQTQQLLISGESFRTSLARRSPETMIQEALVEILQEADLDYVTPQK